MTALESAGVVVGFDGSSPSREAVLWAAAEAVRRDRPLLVVDVLRGPFPELVFTPMAVPLPEVVGEEAVRGYHESRLSEIAEHCRNVSGVEVSTHLAYGHPADVLAGIAWTAELLVVGWSGRTGLARALLGSTAAHLVHHCERPTVVVRGRVHEAGKVVVGVDGSNAGSGAIAFAFDFAARHDARIVAVHAWADTPMETIAPLDAWHYDWHAVERDADTLLADCLSATRDRYPRVRVDRVVTFDAPAHALIEQSGDADLLVVGSHGRGALKRAVLGSVGHAVLYHGTSTLAVVPPSGAAA